VPYSLHGRDQKFVLIFNKKVLKEGSTNSGFLMDLKPLKLKVTRSFETSAAVYLSNQDVAPEDRDEVCFLVQHRYSL
jgi:hypothetical protein